MPEIPVRTRVYRHHHLDSTRWDAFTPRPDDIVIATPYKAGTTWTQAIVAHLLFPGDAFPAAVGGMSPWLEQRTKPLDDVLDLLERQPHRRFIKTHLGLDALRFLPELRYIFVSRDGRDVFMSLWNHYRNYSEEAYGRFNGAPGRVGPELPRAPDDIHAFWHSWCTRGWFEWETDGFPFWSHLGVTQSWWDHRDLPNVLLLHYADMKADTAGAVRRIADFLGIACSDADIRAVAEAVSFDRMREKAATYAPGGGAAWKGGAKTFLYKGSNGRWREVLSAGELALYDAACDRALSPECRSWLEKGGAV